MLVQLAHNLRSGVRAALFLRVGAKAWSATPPQLIALAILAVCLNLALSRTFYTGEVEFDWRGLRELWIDVPLFLLMGWIASRYARRRLDVLLLPVALFAAVVTMDVITTIVSHAILAVSPKNMYLAWASVYWIYHLWLIGIAAVLIYRISPMRVPYPLYVLLPLTVVTVYSLFIPLEPLWYEITPEVERPVARRESPATEEMLYLQPKLAEQSIRSLAAHRRGVADLYFIGFAPYGHEDVFLKESEVIRTLMDDRFGTRGRSLLLVNNSKTLKQYPFATVTNLRAALQRVAAVIDRDEDVVVLYLTSHGSKEHELSARFWPLQLEEITPPLLKQLLDDAGIRWRVVIVSACYSGGFVEPLRGPNTLVMTAADAVNTSFGCGAESDFTYFAKALFDEQLRETYSFEEAFARAVPAIYSREKTERDEFSNPQIAVGDAIRPKLAEIERRLARTPVNPSAR